MEEFYELLKHILKLNYDLEEVRVFKNRQEDFEITGFSNDGFYKTIVVKQQIVKDNYYMSNYSEWYSNLANYIIDKFDNAKYQRLGINVEKVEGK